MAEHPNVKPSFTDATRELVDRLKPGMLLLADRGFCGFPLWARAAATGADLLWRAMSNM